MCGVAGIFSLTGKPIKDAQDRITRMTRLLDHRGPDHWGVTVTGDGLLALGNTRLAIVDPEARPDLPLVSETFGESVDSYPTLTHLALDTVAAL